MGISVLQQAHQYDMEIYYISADAG